jgi:DNA-binding response OmpR family regulator
MSHKILIVDDEPQVPKLLETVLAPKGYELHFATDGKMAWEKINLIKPKLIVLDIMMPEMSGIELCKKIRADNILKNTLVLMLSAKDSQSDRITGLQYGADDYVTKPFHVMTLVNKIEHMLSKKEL